MVPQGGNLVKDKYSIIFRLYMKDRRGSLISSLLKRGFSFTLLTDMITPDNSLTV